MISENEREILQLLAEGHTIPEVAAKTHRSPSTIKHRIFYLHPKLESNGKVTHLVAQAIRQKVIS